MQVQDTQVVCLFLFFSVVFVSLHILVQYFDDPRRVLGFAQVEMGRCNPNNVLVATQQELLEASLVRKTLSAKRCYTMNERSKLSCLIADRIR